MICLISPVRTGSLHMTNQQLNLPDFEARIKHIDDTEYIWDGIRKKYLQLTPEEWVRQHFVHLLINHLHYPAGLIQLEKQHQYFGNDRRSDIVVMNRDQTHYLLVECKAPEVKINTQSLQQISQYNKILQARYIAVTNGLSHFVWSFQNNAYKQLKEFPSFTNE